MWRLLDKSCLRPSLVDVTDNLGSSPLMVTCRLGKPKLAKALLDHQADAEFKNKILVPFLLLIVLWKLAIMGT